MNLDVQLYSAMILLTVIITGVMSVHAANSDAMPRETSRDFILLFALTAMIAILEWAGVMMDGVGATTGLCVLHRIIKCVELSSSPMLGPFWYHCIFPKAKIHRLLILPAISVLMEILSLFFGFIYYVDAQNIYHHAAFYWLYIVSYFYSFALVFISCVLLARRFQNRDIVTLIAIALFLFIGVAIQVVWSSVRTACLTLACSTILFYTYYSDLVRQTDALTGMINRAAFDSSLERLDYDSALFIFDVDEFKYINDTFGHAFGDIVLASIASVIRQAYGANAMCYRIGGDEFAAIMKKKRLGQPLTETERIEIPAEYMIEDIPIPTDRIRALNYSFDRLLEAAREKEPRLPEVSIGYAYFDGLATAQEVFNCADSMMYNKKRRRKATNYSLGLK